MLRVGDKEIQLDVLCTSHALIQGASGSGKSYLIRVLAEQLCGAIQTIIIDPEGEYHTLRERYPSIGRHFPSMAWIAASMGTTARARGFEENTRTLRNKGYIETGSGNVNLTTQGLAFVGHVQPLKGGDLLRGVREVLSGPQWDYLELLINLRRKPLTLERLAEQFNTTVRARGFEENIRFLRNNEMIVTSGGSVVAADWLFV